MAACRPSRCPIAEAGRDRRLRDDVEDARGRRRCRSAVAGDPAAGERFFAGKGKLRQLPHGARTRRRARARPFEPSAAIAGRQQIEQALRDPRRAPPAGRGGRGGRGAAPPYRAVTVRLRDGQTIRGIAKNESAFDLQLLGVDGKLHLLSKDQVAEIVREKSLMPKVEATPGRNAQPGRLPQPALDRSECQGDARDRRTGAGSSVRRRGPPEARLLAHLRRQP